MTKKIMQDKIKKALTSIEEIKEEAMKHPGGTWKVVIAHLIEAEGELEWAAKQIKNTYK